MNAKLLVSLTALSLSLIACGDEVTKVTETTGMQVVAAGKSLPKCNKDNIGKMVFVEDSAEVYYCDGSEWSGLNGADGKDGSDGKKGSNGTSCTVKLLADSTGYNVICGGDTVGTVLNGSDGSNGSSCTLIDEGGGAVTMTCGKGKNAVSTTLYKAMCGTFPYDPATAFCHNGEVYDNCGSDTYDPSRYFCHADSVYSNCGTSSYEPDSAFCDKRDSTIYKYVTIGKGKNAQVWMAENLNYKTEGSDCYANAQAWCSGSGGLYTWAIAIDSSKLAKEDSMDCGRSKVCTIASPVQGICPDGWHLPDVSEWKALLTVAGKTPTEENDYVWPEAGKKLRSETGWGDVGKGSDSFGFAAKPAGYSEMGKYYSGTEITYFWSSTEFDSTGNKVYGVGLGVIDSLFDKNSAILESYDKARGQSIRCIKD